MLKREISRKLDSWKNQKKKKALCIIGARQIGKTTIIREFAKKNYEYFVEINFILDKDADKIFEGKLDADTIIENLTAYKMQKFEPGKTLIFLDEIQECPNARCAIKFLVEDGRFDYVESGSLLGVKYKEVPSYAVGFEEIHYMYPMNFREFLVANGVQDATFEKLQFCYEKCETVPIVMHETLLKLFAAYVVVGGMPDVVQTYVDTHDIGKVIEMQRNILELYRQDISKYSEGAEKIKIKAIFDSIASQLDDKKRRFILNHINENARMNRYENAFLWLSEAGVALPSYNVVEPQAPLQLNEKRNLFKLFMGDTGLLCASCMANIQFELLQGNMEVNMGSILENVFAQEIKSRGFALNYFESKKYGELDFVVQKGMKIDILEIKSGNDYKKHSSLNKVSSVSNWKFGRNIVFCKGNVEKEDKIEYLPWYMIMFYEMEREPESFIYEVNLKGI